MRYSPSELERLSMVFDAPMKQLEEEIMADIVRRIRINSEITRSADWQINRLYELGMSKQDIENRIQSLAGISPQEVQSLYSQILEKGYAEDEKIYRLKGKPYIPFEENEQLQQLISATAAQTSEGMQNITQSLGFAIKNAEGKTEFLPIAKYYQSTLDKAMLGITLGAFDYNTILKKTVAQLVNSGLRTVDYASGHSNRVEVATRRAVMTGFNQIVAKVNEENADKLETEYFEVSWHGGARPTHQVWQGRVYSKKDLETVCGLGDVQGLCGANCYHSYHPFDPEIDVRTYTDEQLDEMNRQENTPVEFGGKQYTKYEALQRQRRLETTMRAERQTIKLLQEGGASEDEIMLARGRYRVTSSEYTRFSKAMNLPQQRERVTVDGLGNIGVGKYKLPDNINKPVIKNSTVGSVANSNNSGIINTGSEGMFRKAKKHNIEPMPKKQLQKIEKSFKKRGGILQYSDETDKYLESKNAEAITYNATTILIRQNPGRASVFEELIHAHQYRTGKNDGSYVSRLKCEIEAQKKLINHSKLFKLTDAEILQTKSALKSYEAELKAYYKQGGN